MKKSNEENIKNIFLRITFEQWLFIKTQSMISGQTMNKYVKTILDENIKKNHTIEKK